MIRILLVDDDPTCRDGLRQLLGLVEDFQIVGEAEDFQEAYRLALVARPDVVLVDADLPCSEIIARLGHGESISDEHPSVICLAVYPDQHDAALRAGASRFLRKDDPPRELFEAIRAAAARPRDLPADSDSPTVTGD